LENVIKVNILQKILNFGTVPLLMGLFTVLSLLKPWFHPTVHVAVVVKAALEHVCIPAL